MKIIGIGTFEICFSNNGLLLHAVLLVVWRYLKIIAGNSALIYIIMHSFGADTRNLFGAGKQAWLLSYAWFDPNFQNAEVSYHDSSCAGRGAFQQQRGWAEKKGETRAGPKDVGRLNTIITIIIVVEIMWALPLLLQIIWSVMSKPLQQSSPLVLVCQMAQEDLLWVGGSLFLLIPHD